jgi:hypothetical protein
MALDKMLDTLIRNHIANHPASTDADTLDGHDSLYFAETTHSHAQLHDRQHAINSAADHTGFGDIVTKNTSYFSDSLHNHTGVYLSATGTAVDSALLNGKNMGYFAETAHTHTGVYLSATGTAVDSALLSGKNIGYFAETAHTHTGVYLAAAGKAADSELLDAHDSLYFATSTDYVAHRDDATDPHGATLDQTTLHATTALIDHIGEHTGSHKVVLDNTLSRAGIIEVDHIAEATGSHTIIFDNTDKTTVDSAGVDTEYRPNVLYNTDATPPAANTVPIGTIYIQYTA